MTPTEQRFMAEVQRKADELRQLIVDAVPIIGIDLAMTDTEKAWRQHALNRATVALSDCELAIRTAIQGCK